MKRIALMVISMLLGLMLLAGCDMLVPGGSTGGTDGPGSEQEAQKTPLEQIEEKYAKLSEAGTIAQSIGITQNGVVQYESQKTYKKAGAGYQVTGTEKRLNSLTSGKPEAYTETPVEMTVKAGNFAVQLDLDELYFASSKIENGTLEATVMDSSVETVLGITEDLPAPVHGLTLKIATDASHVTGIDIGYASGASTVSIALKFTY